MATPERFPSFGFRTDDEEVADVRERVTAFLVDYVDRTEAAGVVVGMSGGIDSSLTAALAAEALGPDRVLGLVMPARKDDDSAAATALGVADDLGVETATVQLRPLVGIFEDSVEAKLGPESDRTARGNAVARLRAAVAYYAANRRNLLVCGTTNRTEWLLGYFTKFGDGAADLRPLVGCYKTEVRALASRLDLPAAVRERPPSPGLWVGQTDADELGAPYELVDPILTKLVDEDLGVAGTAAELGVSEEQVRTFARMHAAATHKRRRPPSPGEDPPVPDGFHELELTAGE